MKIKILNYQVLILVISFLFCSCEKEQLLMSSSKVEKELEATWEKIDMTSEQSHISWIFSKGKVYLLKSGTELTSGNYKVHVSATKVHIKIADFPEPGYDYMNGNWKVLTLDDELLVIAGSYSGGVLQSEFTKQ